MEPTKEKIEKWHNDSNNWKLGVFYYNPEDPRGLVDKRAKWAGATLNFAHKSTVRLFFITLIVFLLLLFLTFSMLK